MFAISLGACWVAGASEVDALLFGFVCAEISIDVTPLNTSPSYFGDTQESSVRNDFRNILRHLFSVCFSCYVSYVLVFHIFGSHKTCTF